MYRSTRYLLTVLLAVAAAPSTSPAQQRKPRTESNSQEEAVSKLVQRHQPSATALQSKLEIHLLPDYQHEPLQGIDSIVGRIVKKGGASIQYDIGGVPKPGGLQLGGQYVNQAERMPADQVLWRKKQMLGGREMHIAYSKSQHLIVSAAFGTLGVTFSAEAKSTEAVADILLMVASVAESKEEKRQ